MNEDMEEYRDCDGCVRYRPRTQTQTVSPMAAEPTPEPFNASPFPSGARAEMFANQPAPEAEKADLKITRTPVSGPEWDWLADHMREHKIDDAITNAATPPTPVAEPKDKFDWDKYEPLLKEIDDDDDDNDNEIELTPEEIAAVEALNIQKVIAEKFGEEEAKKKKKTPLKIADVIAAADSFYGKPKKKTKADSEEEKLLGVIGSMKSDCDNSGWKADFTKWVLRDLTKRGYSIQDKAGELYSVKNVNNDTNNDTNNDGKDVKTYTYDEVIALARPGKSSYKPTLGAKRGPKGLKPAFIKFKIDKALRDALREEGNGDECAGALSVLTAWKESLTNFDAEVG